MLLINFLFLSTFIDNNNFYYTKRFTNNFESSKFYLISNDFQSNKIGVVDFRKVLRSSNAMQILGNNFISAEKRLNQKLNLEQVTLKQKEIEILKQKKLVSIEKYNSIITSFKEDVFKIQNNNKQERLVLNNSFKKIQQSLKDLLAKVIKEISMRENINIVFLKENIFLLNDQSADLTNEVLNSFNKKTKNIKIKIINFD